MEMGKQLKVPADVLDRSQGRYVDTYKELAQITDALRALGARIV